MGVIKRTELDFFKSKILSDKEAVLYVRNGDVFFWSGSDKIVIDDPEEEVEIDGCDEVETFGTKMVPIDRTKDRKVNGFFYFWQSEQYYGLVFFDHKRHHDPVCLKFGDALND